MANAKYANVYVCDTAAAISLPIHIKYILFVPGLAGTDNGVATLLAGGSGTDGAVIWTSATRVPEHAVGDRLQEQVEIRDNQGVYVTITGTNSKLYLYTVV